MDCAIHQYMKETGKKLSHIDGTQFSLFVANEKGEPDYSIPGTVATCCNARIELDKTLFLHKMVHMKLVMVRTSSSSAPAMSTMSRMSKNNVVQKRHDSFTSDDSTRSVLLKQRDVISWQEQTRFLADIRLQVYLPKTVQNNANETFSVTFSCTPVVVPVAPELLLRDLNKTICSKYRLDFEKHALKFLTSDGKTHFLPNNVKHKTAKCLATTTILVVPTSGEDFVSKQEKMNDEYVDNFLLFKQHEIAFRVFY